MSSINPSFNPLPTYNLLSDSISQLSGEVLGGSANLDSYLSALGSASTGNLNSQNQAANTIFSSYSQFYNAIGQSSAVAQSIAASIIAQADFELNLYNSQVAEETLISNYNSKASQKTLNNAISTLNGAISNYNKTSPPTTASENALNTAINTYTQAVSSIAGPYNSSVAGYNALVAQIPAQNAIRQSLGMPLLPVSSQISAGLPANAVQLGTPPFNIVSGNTPPLNPVAAAVQLNSIIPIPTPPLPPQNIELIDLSLYFVPAADNIISQSTNLTTITQLSQAVQHFQAALNPSNPALPNAFIQQIPEALFSLSTGINSGVGVGSLVLGTGISSNILSTVVTNAIIQAYLYQASQPPPPALQSQINVLVNTIVNQIINATAATNPSLADITDPQQAAAETAIAFANTVNDFVNSGQLTQAVNQLILTSPLLTLPLTQRQDLVSSLDASLNLGLLQLAALQLSTATGLPGLPSQILGNLTGAPTLAQLAAKTPAQKAQQVIQDPIKEVYVKYQLYQTLVQQGYTSDQATSLTNNALNPLFQQNYNNVSDFENAVTKALQGQGVNPTLAQALGNQAGTFVNNEVSLPFLDQTFVPGALSAINTAAAQGPVDLNTLAAANPEINSQFPVGSPQRGLLNQDLSTAFQDPNVVAAINASLQENPSSIRQFRQSLISNGATAAQANTITALLAPTPSSNPLLQPQPTTQLSPTELYGSVTDAVVNGLTPGSGVVPANLVAGKVNSAVVHIVTLSNLHISTLRANNQYNFLKTYYQQAADNAQPSIPLFAQTEDTQQRVTKTLLFYQTPAAQNDLRNQSQKTPLSFTPPISPQV